MSSEAPQGNPRVRGEYSDRLTSQRPVEVAGLSVPAVTNLLSRLDDYRHRLDPHAHGSWGYDFLRMVSAVPVLEGLAADPNLTAATLSQDDRRALRVAGKAGAKYLPKQSETVGQMVLSRIVRRLEGIDTIARAVPPGRRLLNHTIDERAADLVQQKIPHIGTEIVRAESVAHVIGSFESPREAWRHDVESVYGNIVAYTKRLQGEGLSQPEAVGRALMQVIGELLTPEEIDKYPFLRPLIKAARKFKDIPLLPSDEWIYQAAAPVVLEVLETTLGKDHTVSQEIGSSSILTRAASVLSRMPGLGLVARVFKNPKLIREKGPRILQAVENALPENGSAFKEAFDQFAAPFKARIQPMS